MIINLTKSIPNMEICRISLLGTNLEEVGYVEWCFSQAALIGFGTELLKIYEDINENTKLSLCTYPLKDCSPNQTIGFYLTPNSPMLVFNVNTLSTSIGQEDTIGNAKEISIRNRNTNQNYNIFMNDMDVELEQKGIICLDTYELGRRNIVSINVFNDKGENITNYCNTVVLEINREGLKELATMLFVWANNYQYDTEYFIAQDGQKSSNYNLGVILTKDSVQTKFKSQELGSAYDYDKTI